MLKLIVLVVRRPEVSVDAEDTAGVAAAQGEPSSAVGKMATPWTICTSPTSTRVDGVRAAGFPSTPFGAALPGGCRGRG